METLAALGGGAFVLASLAVGVRLLLLSVRSGELPEFSIGLALLLMGGVGYPAAAAARGVPGLDAVARVALAAVAMACMGAGTVGIAVFNWKVFRPDRALARRLVRAIAAGGLACFVWQAFAPGFLAAAENRGSGLRGLEILAAVSLAWAAFESVSYSSKLGKRLVLGLADPVVTDRVRLWAVAIVAAQTLNALSLAAISVGVDLATWRYGGALIGPLGLVAALSMWLAFLPPERYRRSVAARARRRTSSRRAC
jgi:hypothetical protein